MKWCNPKSYSDHTLHPEFSTPITKLHIFYTLCNVFSRHQEVSTALEQFSKYSEIWMKDRDTELKDFMKQEPRLSEFESQILYYMDKEKEILGENTHYDVGAIALYTGMTTSLYHGFFICSLDLEWIPSCSV